MSDSGATVPPPPEATGQPSRPHQDGSRAAFWLVWIGSWALRLLASTLRLQVELPAQLRDRSSGEPFIFVFWHNRLLLVPIIWNTYLHGGNRPLGKALTSMSRDGELVALFLDRFGIGSVRGSSARGGSASVRELAGWLKRGHDIGITPDGSRGPCYQIKPGLILLAQLSGRAILPMSFEYSSSWRLKSWDRFFIPKPFSTVRFVAGSPHLVPRTSTPEAFENERRQCEQIMLDQVEER